MVQKKDQEIKWTERSFLLARILEDKKKPCPVCGGTDLVIWPKCCEICTNDKDFDIAHHMGYTKILVIGKHCDHCGYIMLFNAKTLGLDIGG